jgi:hypothetical protein
LKTSPLKHENVSYINLNIHLQISPLVFVFINCAILVFQTVFHILLILKYIIYSTTDAEDKEDPRILGLAMIPGHQIVTVHIDENNDIDHRIL